MDRIGERDNEKDANGDGSELAREKMWARIHLIPALQAEEDRDLVRRHLADQAREKELLGENIKVYNSDRCVFSLFSPVRPSLGWAGREGFC